jgi:sugar phosphate isomerase/epimerase
MEIGTGGYPGTGHCPIDELLADAGKAKAWKKKFEDRGIQVATLSCHGNPVHPDEKHAARDRESFRKTILLAERLDVRVVVGFSGCPGGTPTDTQPNWITYRWPPEYGQMLDWQWKEKVVPYWKETAKFAREHGVHRIALEMHPNFVVYNPRTLLQLREAAGEEIGANCDLSHLFWQGCDPVEVIHFLGKHKAISGQRGEIWRAEFRVAVGGFAAGFRNISRGRLWTQRQLVEVGGESVHGHRL